MNVFGIAECHILKHADVDDVYVLSLTVDPLGPGSPFLPCGP